jgi:hypothetical protein
LFILKVRKIKRGKIHDGVDAVSLSAHPTVSFFTQGWFYALHRESCFSGENGGANYIPRPCFSRIDTPIKVDYYRHGGILPYVLREVLCESGMPTCVGMMDSPVHIDAPIGTSYVFSPFKACFLMPRQLFSAIVAPLIEPCFA